MQGNFALVKQQFLHGVANNVLLTFGALELIFDPAFSGFDPVVFSSGRSQRL